MTEISSELLEERLIDFAVRIIHLSEALPKTSSSGHLSKQILRSGTSPALNYSEARSAESSKDFVHKLRICLKELRETHTCLKIILKMKWLPTERLDLILQESNELVSIFVSSIKTMQTK